MEICKCENQMMYSLYQDICILGGGDTHTHTKLLSFLQKYRQRQIKISDENENGKPETGILEEKFVNFRILARNDRKNKRERH